MQGGLRLNLVYDRGKYGVSCVKCYEAYGRVAGGDGANEGLQDEKDGVVPGADDEAGAWMEQVNERRRWQRG